MDKKWLEFRQNSIDRKKREFRYAEFIFLAPIPRFHAELSSAAGFDSGIRFNYEQKYSENKNEFNQNTNQLYKNHAICDTKIIYFTTL